MRETSKLSAKIGSVRIPVVGERPIGTAEPDGIGDAAATEQADDLTPYALKEYPLRRELVDPRLRFRFCRIALREGCYTLTFVPDGASILSTRYRGTLRVEDRSPGYRISGDLYRYRLFDDLVLRPRNELLEQVRSGIRYRWPIPEFEGVLDPTVPGPRRGRIPIHARDDYFSYLEGTSAMLFDIVPAGDPCRFSLSFDEYEYDHPATGFSGSFSSSPNRSLTFRLRATGTPHRYEGTAHDGSGQVGSVVIQHVSDFVRRATLVVNTLQGSVAPAPVAGQHFGEVMATARWDLTVIDDGEISMPATITGQDPDECWSEQNLHRLMQSVDRYDPDDLDHVWRSHLLAVQAEIGCGRGIVFDHPGGDLNSIAREGSATFSDDGYPASNSSNFGTAEGEQQRDVPRAFLRSASHEVGHAFNQIHQSFEGGNDNSIMTTTGACADAIAADGDTFPDDISLAFNDTVRRHLMHLPDPAVRPGAMDFFGSAVNAPEPADISTMPDIEVTVVPGSEQVRLGEPLELAWRLTNTGNQPMPVPDDLDHRSLVSRISVEDPDGRVTFLRPPDQRVCEETRLRTLEPGDALEADAVAFYGRDGFAFTRPGAHTVTVVVLWDLDGQHVLAQGQARVWVAYPVSDQDNEVAALLLDPEVGVHVATRGRITTQRSRERLREAARISKTHAATATLQRLGLEP